MPAYNCGPWIAQAVSSVLAQQGCELELIVVDDGSTDDTVQIVQAISDPRLRLLHCPHAGQSVASNLGAAAARGQLLKFVDADDVLLPGHLSAQLAAGRDHAGCLVSCRWGYFRDDWSRITPRRECVQQDFTDPLEWIVTSLTRDEGMMGVWMWLIPVSVWEKSGGFNQALTLNKDFDLSIRLLLGSSGVRYAAEAVYGYRKGLTNAVTQTRNRASMESALRTTELGISSLLARENSPRIRRIAANRLQMWLYRFFPDHPDLVQRAEHLVDELGGSDLRLQGGLLLRLLEPLIGWKGVRRLQSMAVRFGWGAVQRWKQGRRLRTLR
jgi:glycosyltransferase involved in cell wall biosynthesis